MYYTDSITNENVFLPVDFFQPTEKDIKPVYVAFARATKAYTGEEYAVKCREFVKAVNDEIKANAVNYVRFQPDIIVACASAVKYGGFMWSEDEGISHVSTFYKKVSVPDKERPGKYKKEERPVFVTYLDCHNALKAENSERKKHNKPLLEFNSPLSIDENRLIRYFIYTDEGRFDKDKAVEAEAHGELYRAFYAPERKPGDAIRAQLNAVYGVINKRTGENVHAVPYIKDNLHLACNSHNSMTNDTRHSKFEKWVSNIICEWVNSKERTACAGRYLVKNK